MDNKTFYEMLQKMHKEEVETMVSKGKEYTVSSDDKLENFKAGAKSYGVDPKIILGIFLDKHLASIRNYIKTNREFSTESIEGRIMDARNYLALLRGLITEQKKGI